MAKKAYIGVQKFIPRNIPNGYTQVEYIESSGTQYIDTGFKPNNNTRVVMDFRINVRPMYNHVVIFGARDAANVNSFCVFYIKNGYFRSDYGTTNTNQWDIDVFGKYTIDKNKETTSLGGTTQSYSATTFQCNYNLYLFRLNTGGSGGFGCDGLRVFSCKIYDNGTLIRDYVPCLNANGVAGLYDAVNGVFYENAGTGSFLAVNQVHNDVARTINQMYLGIDNLARKIKKAYVGIGGVARPCWGGGKLEYWGTATNLSTGRRQLAATTVGNYALFGGGNGNTYSDVVDAYDTSLTRTAAAKLNLARCDPAATTVGDYALFGGGYDGNSATYYYVSDVTAIDASLTKRSVIGLSVIKTELAATTVGDYALFGGGIGGEYSSVDAYSTSLGKRNISNLSIKRNGLAATTVGNYALFGGGNDYKNNNVSVDTVDAYDTSLTRTTPTPLSTGRKQLAATTVGNYALFGGGGRYSAVVDAYDTSLTRTTPTPLSNARALLAATTVNGYALFGGGQSPYSDVVDAYDTSLTRTVMTSLSVARLWMAATTVGNYALFGGGYGANRESSAVDVYTIA